MGETQVLGDDRGGTAARAASGGAPMGAGATLYQAVVRLRRELAGYRPLLSDRAVAQDELAVLVRQAEAAQRCPTLIEAERLRRSLLLLVSSLGSVSALAAPLGAVREAVEALAPPR